MKILKKKLKHKTKNNQTHTHTHTQFRYIQEEKTTTLSLLASTSTKPSSCAHRLFATSGREDRCHNLFQQNPHRIRMNTKTTEKKEVHCYSHLASASTKPNLQSYRKKKTKSTHNKNTQFSLPKKEERERESSLPRCQLSGFQ